MDRTVEPLRKIRLSLQAGTSAAVMDIPLADAEAVFIFGIGSDGLTPLECLLNGRREAETIAFRVSDAEAGRFFGHVAPSLDRLAERRDEVYFQVSILAVETPQPREVIQAMAELANRGHGHGCDCGCGCA